MSTRAFAFVSILLFPALATAAPFCAVTGGGTNCAYSDVQSCRLAAGPSGACVVNPNEMQSQRSSPQGSGIHFSTAAPAIKQFQDQEARDNQERSQREADFAARFAQERQLARQNTDPRLRPLLLRPDGEISSETHSAIMSTLFTTLDMNAPGTSRDWRNPQTGASGTVLAKEIVQNMFGEPCRAFTVSLSMRGEERSTSGNACRKNGQWIWQGN